MYTSIYIISPSHNIKLKKEIKEYKNYVERTFEYYLNKKRDDRVPDVCRCQDITDIGWYIKRSSMLGIETHALRAHFSISLQ